MAKKKQFDLNKNSQHEFDISKGSKIRFDLSKDSDDENPKENLENTINKSIENKNVSEGKSTGTSKIKKWIILVVLLILGLLIWLLVPSDKTNSVNGDNIPLTTEMPTEESVSEEAVNSNKKVLDEPVTVDTTSVDEPVPNDANQNVPVEDTNNGVNVNNNPNVEPFVSSNVSSDIKEEALKVVQGIYGNGEVRKAKLGSKYSEIQNKVNEMYKNGLFY